ncbi:MAG: DegT/DnrJ/EryC1/StrS family aminotransferase [Spirochaetaceae bacterium]|nr:DegT/DnrJ/EryC1/StrS family aminotransferase [Spirochaetaceae bacterium]
MTPLFCSYFKRKEMDSVLNCLMTDSIGPGDLTEKFVKTAREKIGFEAGMAFRSPYSAMVAALQQLGLAEGSKIGLSPLAPLYHLLAIRNSGYIPCFIDYSLETCLPIFESLASQGCSAFLCFEPFGMLADKAQLADCSIPVIEDITQALGARKGEQMAGDCGEFVVYGTENTSIVNTGGGALLFTRNRKNAPIVRAIADKTPAELILSDYNAALGLAQFKEMEQAQLRREELETRFQLSLARTRHKTFKQEAEGKSGLYAFPIILESGMNEVLVHARKNGIECSAAFDTGIISHESFPDDECPQAHAMARRTVLFPLHQRISAQEASIIEKVIATLP